MAFKNLILLNKIWMVEPNAWLKKMENNTGPSWTKIKIVAQIKSRKLKTTTPINVFT